MRVVALISGGKDSCYNMMKCVEAGHEIVALANLQPQDRDELDSYMFQTVGHEGISLYAEAMGLPLYRVTTRGCSVTRELQYIPTDGDEVEDLYQLLCQVKEELGVEAVSSGAVLSDYQRLRVENVCSRLQLVSLAYMWRRDQSELLQEMIESGVNAVVIKVAAMGLTEKNLGVSIKELYPEALKLHDRYGINVCGEGGEYETYTLDCPLFKKQIVIDASEVVVHSADAFAPVAYLKLKQLHLKEKDEILAVKSSPKSVQLNRVDATIEPVKVLSTMIPSDVQPQIINRGAYSWFSLNGNQTFTSVLDQTQNLFDHLDTELSKCGHSWEDIVLVYLSLSDMTSYPAVNGVYSKYFPSKPPARVCVAMQLPCGVHVKMEVMVWRCETGRSSMHVQSYSQWAPANIGPYSQAYTVSDTVFLAGQIGLVPSTMVLAGPSEQPSLSLRHIQSVLTACHTHLTSALCGVCYYTTDESCFRAKESWKMCLSTSELQCGCPLVFLQVPTLPRQACVEWHFIAIKEPHEITYSTQPPFYIDGLGLFSLTESWCKELHIGCWMCSIACLECGLIKPRYLFNVVEQGLRHINKMLSKFQLYLSQLSCLRICIPSFGVGEPLKLRDILQFCKDLSGNPDEGIPVSFFSETNYLGHKTEITIQALKLDT